MELAGWQYQSVERSRASSSGILYVALWPDYLCMKEFVFFDLSNFVISDPGAIWVVCVSNASVFALDPRRHRAQQAPARAS